MVILGGPLCGCVASTIASTAVSVATLPVRVVSAGVDAATTSQAEADQNRGRRLRQAEEAFGRQLREWQKACDKARKRDRQCEPEPVFVAPR